MADYQHFSIFQTLFANYFCDHVCVPIFFILSGFLFFLKTPESFSLKWFGNKYKYKSRVHSLLIPYLIANAFFILAFVALDIYQGNTNFDVLNLLKGFWTKEGRFPADPPLWFMRDLLVVVLFTPLVYLGIKKLSFFVPLLFGLWYVSGYPDITVIGVSDRAFFFFSVGAWLAIKSVDFIDKMRCDWVVLVFWIVYFIILALYMHYKHDWLLRLSVLPACPALIATVKRFTNQDKPCPHSFVVCTVFTYLYHYYVVMVVWRLLLILFGTTETSIFLSFFLGVLITVISFYYTYLLLNRLFPKITSVIVGGR